MSEITARVQNHKAAKLEDKILPTELLNVLNYPHAGRGAFSGRTKQHPV